MTNLTTIKQCNELAAVRAAEIFKSDDKAKIEQALMLSSKAADYVVENYPSMTEVFNDYELWKEMSLDVNNQSIDLLKLVYTEEEFQKTFELMDDDGAMLSHWKELREEIECSGHSLDSELKDYQEVLHDFTTNL